MMSLPQAITVSNLDHLGLVAGMIDELGIVEKINDLVGSQPGEKVSPGHAVKAMIINGLGLVSSPLYLFSKFFEGKATEHLIGEGIKPEYLNDDRLGRVLDKLYLVGLSQIFTAIALVAARQFNVALNTAHLDASSFHVHGKYESNLPEVYFLTQEPSLTAVNQVEINPIAAPQSRIKNQLGQLTDRPTLRWIFQCFQAIHLLQINGVEQISNLTDERLRILRFFPVTCQDYYLIT
jgi:hypothetical protein